MKLHQLFESFTAAQKKEIAAKVKEIKESDGKIKRADLYKAEDEAFDDDAKYALVQAVNKEVLAWANAAREEYRKLQAEVEEIEAELGRNAYLFDESVDMENVLVGGRTDDSVDFWPMMVSAASSAVGERASQYGININKRLGRTIY
jgi:hypothetical protein